LEMDLAEIGSYFGENSECFLQRLRKSWSNSSFKYLLPRSYY
jgi:uncharacterized protein YmfQ (DUF2313 family)